MRKPTKASGFVRRGLLAAGGLALVVSCPVCEVQAQPVASPSPVASPALSLEPARVGSGAVGPTRLFFSPTARTLPRGRGSLALTEIAFPWVEAGVLDRVSVMGLVVPPLPDLTSGGFVVAPKVQLLRRDRVQVAAGVIQGFGSGGWGGIGYGVVTVGSADTAATLGYGYRYASSQSEWGGGEGTPGVLFLGAEKSLGRSWRLVAEGWIGGQALGLPERTLVGAARFTRGRWSADLGVVVPIYETGAGTPAPLLTVAWSF